MKITNVAVERTFNLGQYESIKIRFDAQLSEQDKPLEVTADLEMLCHQHIENRKAGVGTAVSSSVKPNMSPSAAPTPPPAPKPQLPPLQWEAMPAPVSNPKNGPWEKCIQIQNPALQEIMNQLTDHGGFYSDDIYKYWLLTEQGHPENVKGVGRRSKA